MLANIPKLEHQERNEGKVQELRVFFNLVDILFWCLNKCQFDDLKILTENWLKGASE